MVVWTVDGVVLVLWRVSGCAVGPGIVIVRFSLLGFQVSHVPPLLLFRVE